MQVVKKILTGGLNAEDAEHLIGESEYVNAENIRIGTTDKGGSGFIENIQSPLLRENPYLPEGTNITIGTAVDEGQGYMAVFNWNSNSDHGIYLFDVFYQIWYTVLTNADVTGGLRFSKYHLVHSARIVNNQLIWTDNTNEPRMISLGAFIKINHSNSSPISSLNIISSPIDESELTLIKKPPAYPPGAEKKNDAGFDNNFIRNESFQFALQFEYYDNTFSVLGPWSISSFLNTPSEDYNYIRVFTDSFQSFPDTMRMVVLWARDGATNKVFKIKTWDKEITDEAAEIASGFLSFDFYNNARGEFLDDVVAVKPFDSVPNLCQSLEVAKNRLNLSDITEGYDTPKSTDLTLSLQLPVSLGFTTLNKNLYEVRHRYSGILPSKWYAYSAWYVYLNEVVPSGWYAVTSTEQTVTGSFTYPTLPSAPTTVAFSGLTFRGADQAAVITNTRPSGYTITSTSQFLYTGYVLSITSISQQVYRIFLPQTEVKAGIVFYDRYLRKCGVVTRDDLTISIPQRDFAFSSGYHSIGWYLPYGNELTEIPEWAWYYSVVRTKNTRTDYLVSGYDNAARYATRDSNGLFVYTTTAALPTNGVALAINAGALLQANLGYVFNEGDQCILTRNDNTVFEIPVIGQDGNYILLQPTEVGNLSTATFVYQIYTPKKGEEPFYEVGQMYPIFYPGTAIRQYSVDTGSFRADSFVMTRVYNATTYYAEAMSPNDSYYDRWDTDAGRINIITKLGQTRSKSGVRFSNVFIPGTSVNGLSSFEALNKEILPEEMGAIGKLQLTSKVQGEGSVMLAIGENETASIYIEETQLFDIEGAAFLAKASGYIGQVNILQGSFGTTNPESVKENGGQVFWFDAGSNCWVRYGGNGLYPISNNKLKRVAKLISSKFAELTVSEIEGLGGKPFVFGGYDRYHEEYMACVPALETSPKGDLEDYSPAIRYPYDIYDGSAKTFIYKNEADRWMGCLKMQPEWMEGVGNMMFSFKNGECYQHNVSDTYNEFHGQQGSSKIMFLINNEPSKVKEFMNMIVEGNLMPDFVHCRTELPNIQSTDLEDTDFSTREGVFYAYIKRDRLSPNVSGSYNLKMNTGDKMRGQWLKVMLQFDGTGILQLRFVNVGYKLSSGHSKI